MAFGRPKPSSPKLPVSVENCTHVGLTTITHAATTASATEDEFNFLYSVSYAWYAAFGFVVTICTGLLVSIVVSKVGYCTTDTGPDPNLLFNCVRPSIEDGQENKNITAIEEEEHINPR